jgi:hypothetical protein
VLGSTVAPGRRLRVRAEDRPAAQPGGLKRAKMRGPSSVPTTR